MRICVSHAALATSLIALSTGSIGVAQAQIAADQATASAPAPKEQSEDVVIVTAQRRGENIQDVPISIQALSADDLVEQGVSQVQDLQKVVSNVTITSPLGQGSAPAINIRGIGLNDFNTNNSGPNGIYVDEFAVSSPNAQGLSFFDLERVEVLKGPQGTLYGRNSSGGAVNITTARPDSDFGYNLRASYGSFDSVDVEGAVTGSLGETMSGRLSAMYKYSEGFMYNHLYDRHENGVDMWGVRGQLAFEPTDEFRALLKLQAVRNSTRAPMYKHFGTFDPVTGDLCSVADIRANNCVDLFGYGGRKGFYEGDWDNGDAKVSVDDYNATLRMEYELGGGLNLVSVTGYNYNDRFHPEQSDAGPAQSLSINFGALSKEFTQEVRLSQDAGPLTWVVGAFYIDERIKQNQPLSVLLDLDDLLGGPGSADGIAYIQDSLNRQTTQSEAIFGQLEYRLDDQWSLIAGVRQTWEDRSFWTYNATRFQQGGKGNFAAPDLISQFDLGLTDDNFSYRLGTNYKLSDDVLLFASVSTGYKAGGFNGGFLSQDAAERTLQLQPFKPETVTAYEAGFKSELADGAVTLNASAFYNDYKDQQVSILRLIPDPSSLTGTRILFALSNADEARVYGIDADAKWEVTPDFNLTAQLGLIDAEFTKFITATADLSGNKLSLAPKVTATLGANYSMDLGFGILNAQYSASYRSKQFFEPTNDPSLYQDGYWLQNARLGLSFGDDAYEVALFARNLADEEYLIWDAALVDPFGINTGTTGEPRFIGIEFRARQ